MKLTKHMRDAFVSAVMNDVPVDDCEERLRKEVMRASLAALPNNVRSVWMDDETRPYLKTIYRHYAGQSICVPGIEGGRWTGTDPIPSLFSLDKLLIDNLAAQCKAQAEYHSSLKQRLKNIADSSNTRKQLLEALPEFEKYLPADTPTACKTLPAIANIVTDFVKAGWPKGKK